MGSPASATVTAKTSHHQYQGLQRGYLVRIYRDWVHFSTCSNTILQADTRPYSPTTLLEPITHAGITNCTDAVYGKVDHTPTCAYRLLSFPASQPYLT